MKRPLQYITIGLATALLGGCTLFGGGTPEENAEIQPSPTAKPLKKQNFSKPTVAGKDNLPPKPKVTAVSLLLPNTDPNERVKGTNQGRQDPFASVVGDPMIQIQGDYPSVPPVSLPIIPPIPSTTTTTGGTTTGGTTTGGTTTGGTTTGRTTTSGTTTPSGTKRNPITQLPPQPKKVVVPFIPELPPLPQPTLAQGILVKGVIQVGNIPHAIIKVPNEKSTRYVKVGQLVGKQVLVKRIMMNDDPTPSVVFEQYGIEVVKYVESEEDKTQTTADNASNTTSNPL